MLVLIYNRMFGQSPGLDEIAAPAGVRLTEDRRAFVRADAVVFHIPTLGPLFFARKRPGQLWVAWSMECEDHYRRLRDPRFMGRFDLTMTHRQDADVMTSYIPRAFLEGRVPPAEPVEHLHFACSFVSGRHDTAGRARYLAELGRHIAIHRYGRRGDRPVPDDLGFVSKRRVAGRYRFTLAFENALARDYVSEKLYDPLLAGSVPVYRGAPNVADFAPAERCYVDASAFAGPAELARHLLALAADEQAYQGFLRWRDRPAPQAFQALVERNRRLPLERLCELLASRR